MSLVLSEDQTLAIKAIQEWHKTSSQPFCLGGLAGTGKTTILSQVPKALDIQDVHFCAPTGKAAKVLTSKLPNYTATTVHRLLYRPTERHCEECPRFNVPEDDQKTKCHNKTKCSCGVVFKRVDPDEDGTVIPKLIVVDEASMVNETMYEDLMFLGTRLLFVGDHGQLPPVEGSLNLMAEDNLDFKLERIHRQAEGSPILDVAYKARNGVPLTYGEHGPGVFFAKRSEVSIDWGGGADSTVISYTNRTRMGINNLVRRAQQKSDEPIIGDKVICLRNNPDKGIVNGTIGTILHIEPWGDVFGVKIALEGAAEGAKPYEGAILPEQFSEAATQWAPRDVDLWTYAYCLTCHKAQGSEAEDVIVILERFHPNMSKDDRNRWLYTAFTRAKKSLTIIDWNA